MRRKAKPKPVPAGPAITQLQDLIAAALEEERSAARQKTLSVPEAGEMYFGIGRGASYRAAHRGDIPTIKVGRLWRVPRELMERRLLKIADTA